MHIEKYAEAIEETLDHHDTTKMCAILHIMIAMLGTPSATRC